MNNAVQIDIGRAFGFITEDPKWITKILIGGLISLIPIVGTLMISGYAIATGRRVMERHPYPLPEWDNMGDLIKKGFFYFLMTLVYILPIVLVNIGLTLIVGIIGSVAGGSDAATALILLLTLGGLVLMLVVVVVVVAMLYAAAVRYIQTDSLGDALQFGTVFEMVRARPVTWLWLFLVNLLTGLVAVLGLLACGFGALFTALYAQAAFGHALGQVAAQLSMSGEHDNGQNLFDPSV